jgi:hypothetical protein
VLLSGTFLLFAAAQNFRKSARQIDILGALLSFTSLVR